MNHSFTRLVTKCQLCARDIAGTGHMVDRINRAKVHTVTIFLGKYYSLTCKFLPMNSFCN